MILITNLIIIEKKNVRTQVEFGYKIETLNN